MPEVEIRKIANGYVIRTTNWQGSRQESFYPTLTALAADFERTARAIFEPEQVSVDA